MSDVTPDQKLAGEILIAYVKAVVAAQGTTELVLGGLQELQVAGIEPERREALEALIDSATLTFGITWETL